MRKFGADHQPADRNPKQAARTRRANASIKEALMNAFDKLGNEAFFIRLGKGTGEDKRCLAMIIAKLLPIEVAGAIDTNLTVKIVTQLGEKEIDITPQRRLPPGMRGASPAVPVPDFPSEQQHAALAGVEDPANA